MTTVTRASTVAVASTPVSTVISSRAWSRRSGLEPVRRWRETPRAPTSGTPNPKNTTQLTVCGRNAVPMPATNSAIPASATSSRCPPRTAATPAGNSSSAPT